MDMDLKLTHKHFFDYEHKQLKKEFAEVLTKCPACLSKRLVHHWEKDWFNIDRCKDCGFIFVNPRLNDKATYDFYNQTWIDNYNQSKFYERDVNDETDPDVKENIEIFDLLSSFIESHAGGGGRYWKSALEA